MSRSYYDLSVGPRVLVVDDEPQLVGVVRRFLEHLGLSVEGCASAAAARANLAAGAGGFVLAIVDMVMPEGGGEPLVREILDAHPETRVIATSGYPADVRALEEAAPGRLEFLQKPFTPEMLEAAVKRMLPPG